MKTIKNNQAEKNKFWILFKIAPISVEEFIRKVCDAEHAGYLTEKEGTAFIKAFKKTKKASIKNTEEVQDVTKWEQFITSFQFTHYKDFVI